MSLYPKLTESALALSSDDESEGWRENNSPQRPNLYDGRGSSPVRHVSRAGHEKTTSPSPRRSTVSLVEFERQYSRRSLSSVRGNVREKFDATDGKSRFFSWQKVKDYLYYNGRTNMFIFIPVVGCVLGVLAATILGALQLGKTPPRDNDLRCLGSSREGCIREDHLPRALELANGIKVELRKRAGLCDCLDNQTLSRNMSVEEIQQTYQVTDDATLYHVFLLFLHNPHWGIRVSNKHGRNISHHSTNRLELTDVFQSSHSFKSIFCRLNIMFAVVWVYAKIIFTALVLCGVLLVIGRWCIQSRRREKEAVFTMVEKIVEVLQQHHRNTVHKKDLIPFLAIIHVRDMLIPPSERLRKQATWEKAVNWIARNESRVRVEEGRIAGEDFTVWRWIQSDPPPTEEPPRSRSGRDGFWQGKVFEEYPPGMDSRIAPPAGQPSPCIRLKNMFDPVSYMEEEQVKEIENSILDRCTPQGGVVHILVDRKSTYGCAYLKMDSIAAASKAYSALHGSWYKGKLVTAKYIPTQKYHKWFPQAAISKTLHYPS